MKKKLKLLTVLFAIIMVLTLVFAMTSCVDPNPNDKDEEEEEDVVIDMLVNNGTFYSSKNSSNSQKYVKEVVAGWSKNSGAISYSDAVMGGIDLAADKFDANKNTIKEGLTYPGFAPNSPKDKVDPNKMQDTNALVIASTEKAASVYYRTSASINIEKNKYYKLAIDVCTMIENPTESTGVWIYVTDGVYAEYQYIDTKGVWDTFEMYIEGNNFENRSINIELWLGHGPNYIGTQSTENINPRLTKGVAFFDNIILDDKMTKENYATAKNIVSEGSDKNMRAESAIYADTNFNYESKISSTTTTSSTTKPYYGTKSGTPYGYELIVGKEGVDYSDDRPTVITGSTGTQGIFDMSQLYGYTPKTETDPAKWTDRFKALNDQFIAPSFSDFYKEETLDGKEVATPNLKGRGALAEFEALMIYHSSPSAAGYKSKKKFMIEKDMYYKISVWTYVWAITDDKVYEETFIYKATYDKEALDSVISQLNGNRVELYKDTYMEDKDGKKVITEAGLAEENAIYALIAEIAELDKKIKVITDKAETDRTEEEKAELISLNASKTQKQADLLAKKKLLYKENAFVQENGIYTDSLTSSATSSEKSIKEQNDRYKEYTDKNAKKRAEYDETKSKYLETARNAKSHFKITGASIDADSLDTQYSRSVGEWQQLTYYIRGNELSSRYVNFEFWYGEGLIGSDTLMVGGAFFDNIEISVDSKPLDDSSINDYKELSPLIDENKNIAGLLDDQTENFKDTKATNDTWKFSYEDDRTTQDATQVGIINGNVAEDATKWDAAPELSGIKRPGSMKVKYEGNVEIYNILMLRHKSYTASKLEFSNILEPSGLKEGLGDIIPNKFYRFSMWVMTQDIEKEKGATLNLLKLDKDINNINNREVLTSISSINTKGEWQEVVFYLKGDALDTNRVTFEMQLGSGDVYTPDSHIKGNVLVTAVTMQDNISYTEYSNITSSTYTKTYAFTPSSDTTSETVSNGNFINTDYSETFKNNPEAYDDKGQLTSTATPSNFSINNPINTLSEPKNVKYASNAKPETDPWKLTWDKVDNAVGYEIYVDNFKIKEDGKDVVKRNYKIADVKTEEYTLAFAEHFFISGNIKVRAYGASDSADYGVSPMSSAIENKTSNYADKKGYGDFEEINKNKLDYDFGVVNYKTFDKSKKDLSTIYNSANNPSYFSGKSDNLLMVSSNYLTRGGYTMSSSQSLDSNSYFEISVWVKTEPGTKASITVSNSSNIFYNTNYADQIAADGNYVGFVNQDTKGEWVQYRFYAETSVVSSSIKLEMFLGNKYAEDKKINDDNTSSSKIKQGLSKGTAYFDDISYRKLADEAEYLKLTKGTDEKPKVENKLSDSDNPYFKNQFIFKKLVYTTDSFDAVTTVDEDSLMGDTPKEYSHSRATEGEDSDEARVYGVFSQDTKSEKLENIFGSTSFTNGNDWLPDPFNETALKSFLEGYGKNVLLMANLKDNGQYYKSNSYSFNSESYYEITFYAKAYLPDGKALQFRFEYGDETAKYSTINVKGIEPTNEHGFIKYTMYVYNERTSSVSGNKISFHLGTNIDKTKDFFKGIAAIDNVAIRKIEKNAFTAVKTSYDALSDAAKADARYNVYTFAKTPEKEKPKDDETKTNWFDQNIWLVLSTVIIGLIIILVVVKLSYNKIKKKVIRTKVKPENIIDKVKIEKEETESHNSNDDYDDYTDQ